MEGSDILNTVCALNLKCQYPSVRVCVRTSLISIRRRFLLPVLFLFYFPNENNRYNRIFLLYFFPDNI